MHQNRTHSHMQQSYSNIQATSSRWYHSPSLRIARNFLESMQNAEPHRTQSVEIAIAVHLQSVTSAHVNKLSGMTKDLHNRVCRHCSPVA